jgi:hypothetical protein
MIKKTTDWFLPSIFAGLAIWNVVLKSYGWAGCFGLAALLTTLEYVLFLLTREVFNK